MNPANTSYTVPYLCQLFILIAAVVAAYYEPVFCFLATILVRYMASYLQEIHKKHVEELE